MRPVGLLAVPDQLYFRLTFVPKTDELLHNILSAKFVPKIEFLVSVNWNSVNQGSIEFNTYLKSKEKNTMILVR